MTNANSFSNKKARPLSRLFSGSKNVNYEPVNEPVVTRVSVGFETGTRYVRRISSNALSVGEKLNSYSKVRKAYIAPDAAVLLMPDAIERAAIEELISEESKLSEKKERFSLKEMIKKAAHRESESYTLYGVDTKEIFTEEIEIDVLDGAAFVTDKDIKNEACAADNGDISSRRSAAAEALGKFLGIAGDRFKNFAYKFNHLSGDSDKDAG